MYSDEQFIFLNNVRLLVVPQPVQGKDLLAALGAAYENVESEWAAKYISIVGDPSTTDEIIVYVPFVIQL